MAVICDFDIVREPLLAGSVNALGFRKFLVLSEGPLPKGLERAVFVSERKRIPSIKKRFPSDLKMIIGPPVREMFEDKRVNAIMGLGLDSRSDKTHYRRSLTQVEVDLAVRQNKVIIFNLADIFSSRNPEVIIGRWIQDLKIIRKKDAPHALVSCASDKWGLRSPKDMRFFIRNLR